MKRPLKKSYVFLLLPVLLLTVIVIFWSCRLGEDYNTADGSVKLYYINMDGTSIQSVRYTLHCSEVDRLAITEELLQRLGEEPRSMGIRRLLGPDIACQGFSFSGSVVTLDFPEAFRNLSRTDDVLIRAALVKTLTQAPQTNYVMFTINGEEMTRPDGRPMGRFSADDFLENPETAINSTVTENVVLYFTDEEGTSLIPVSRKVTFSSSTPMEKVIMQQIILGTTTKGFKSTVPARTQLISIAVSNGVCYVNLDEGFLNDQSQDISEQVILYSIVNSLTELDYIDQVQIAVNGDSNGKVRYNQDLNRFYRFNMDIVKYVTPDNTETKSE